MAEPFFPHNKQRIVEHNAGYGQAYHQFPAFKQKRKILFDACPSHRHQNQRCDKPPSESYFKRFQACCKVTGDNQVKAPKKYGG